MNILFLTENFPPEVNAAASRVYERASYWVQAGHQVTVITCAPNFPQGIIYNGYQNRWYQEEKIQGIRVVRVKTFITKNEGIFLRTLDFLSYLFMGTIAAVFQKKPDVVIATSPQFFVAVSAWLTAFLKRKPFVLELSDLWPASIIAVGAMKANFLLKLLEKLELFLYRKAKAIITLTQFIKADLIQRGISASKITVIINGVDLAKYSPQARNLKLAQKLQIKNNDFILGYVGTHGMAQGLENILKAANILQFQSEIKFLFVGEGAAKNQLMKQAEEMQLRNILFVNALPKEQMPVAWSLCNIALVSLKNNPLFMGAIPSKIFEAMGMGIPILLVAPKGEASAIIELTEAGKCVTPGDTDAFVQAVLCYKNNLEFFNDTAKKSQYAAIHYTRERQANDFLAVLQRILMDYRAQAVDTVANL